MPDEKNNIFTFPKNKERYFPPKNNEEAGELIQNFQENYINDSLDMVIPILFQNLYYLGFSSDEKEDERQCTLIVEALRAYMLYKYQVMHPFHKIADTIFEESKETGYLEMKKDMSIIFKYPEVQNENNKKTIKSNIVSK